MLLFDLFARMVMMKTVSLALVFLCASPAASSDDAHEILPPSGIRARGSYETRYFNQSLDHFESLPFQGTWQQRFLYSDEHWNKKESLRLENGCPGPLLLYTGNEGAITGFWSSNGFMIDVLAPRFGGLLIFPEARFYGKSLPFGPQKSFQSKYLQYLSTEQILADYVALVRYLKSTLANAANCPVIAVSISFSWIVMFSIIRSIC